jgi:exocyst complex component 7
MNNLYYAMQKVMDSPPLRELLGDDWLRRHRD